MRRLVSCTLFLLCLDAAVGWSQPPVVDIKEDSTALAVAWSPDGKRLVSGWEDGAVRITDIPSGKEVDKLQSGSPVIGVVFSPDGKTLGVKSGAKDGPLSVWDPKAAKKQKQLAFPGYTCNHIAFTSDGQTLVASGPGEHMVWNHGKGGGYGSRSGQVPAGSSAAVSGDGTVLAWSNPQGAVILFHTDPRKQQRMQIGPTVAFALSNDAGLLAAASPDKSIRLWNVQGAEARKFEGLREPAKLLQFSANGKVLAAASAGDPVVRLWDVASARLRRRLTTNPADIRALALSPDGLSLALASGAHVHVWNVATRELGELGEPKALSADQMQSAWEDLASTDQTKSDSAFRQLAVAQHHALDFLKTRVRAFAVPPVDRKRVDQWITELDHSQYSLRQRASLELAKLGELIQPALEKYLATKPSLEGERRAKKLLERLRDPELTPERLRCLEAVEILEILRTAEARRLLDEISREALISQVRLAARDALERTNRQSPE